MVAQLQNSATAVTMSAILVFASFAAGVELALADSGDRSAVYAPDAALTDGNLSFENDAYELTRATLLALRPEPYQAELDYEYLHSYDYDYIYEYSYNYEYVYESEHIPTGGMPQRVMYLTFDDGPTRHVTPLILDILAERDIQATFFVIGKNVRENPDIMRRIVNEGHTVGIHSDTHDYNQIYASLEAFIKDFTITRDLIAEFTGYYPVIYRFPGGSVTRFNERVRDAAINFLESNGYVYFDWNASIDDSIGGNPTPERLLARGLETVSGDHVIMLAHDTQPATAKMMGRMIDILAEDFVFDVITSDVEPIQMPR